MFPGSIGPMEIVLVLVIALVVLGPKKLPDAGKSLGKGMREFKESLSAGSSSEDHEVSSKSALTDGK